jgi:probable F420-dependent oxidoreductase
MKPFRFGVTGLATGSATEWTALARRLEAQGYATLCLPDHLAERPAPMPALAAAAAATGRLRVGTMVLNNDFRHPVLLAREAATLDVTSGGRFELGLGAGYARAEYEQAGLRFDPGGVRVERLGEAVVIVTRLFQGEAVSYSGRHYQVAGHTLYPRPVQQPRPPLVIGGNGPRLLTLAAAHADVVALSGITFADGGVRREMAGFTAAGVDERVRLVREAAGARVEPPELSALVQRVIVTDDRRGAAEELARRWDFTADEVLGSPFVLLGSIDEIIAQLVAHRGRWGISYYVVFGPFAETFAPIVERLAGT